MKAYYFKYSSLVKGLIVIFAVLVGIGLVKTVIIKDSTLPTLKYTEPIYQGDENHKKIALICNVVWGEEYLEGMLETLKKNETKMTFFIGGQWAEKFPALVKKIDEDGHQIGNHGYAHLHPTKISLDKNVDEIKKTEDIIHKITGKNTKFFHPPYREINKEVAKRVGEEGYITVMSSIDTIDWQRPEPSVIVNRVTTKAHNGAIVLMHPTDPTEKALEHMILEVKKQGYQLVTISELLSNENPEEKFNKDVGNSKP